MSSRISRISTEWRIEPLGERDTRRGWAIAQPGLPCFEIRWGLRRTRPIVTIWIGPGFGNDPRLGRVAYETGPLPELVTWDATWHTWDHNGTGGENAASPDLAEAVEASMYRCLVQGFIPDLRPIEAEGVLIDAAEASKEWRAERKLGSVRWSYA